MHPQYFWTCKNFPKDFMDKSIQMISHSFLHSLILNYVLIGYHSGTRARSGCGGLQWGNKTGNAALSWISYSSLGGDKIINWASLVAQTVKNLPAMWETQVQPLSQ